MNYSQNDADKLIKEQSNLDKELQNTLFYLINDFSNVLTNEKAKEFLITGVCRRLQTIQRASSNIFKLYPPSKITPLSRDDNTDLENNIQALIFHIYGCLDNLAWIIVHEKSLKMDRRTHVGFHKQELISKLPTRIKNYVLHSTFSNWFTKYAKNYRDACAHRIPLYVPPYSVDPKNIDKLYGAELKRLDALFARDFDEYDRLAVEIESYKSAIPLYTHANSAEAVILHPQILCDIKTVLEAIKETTSSKF